MRRANAIPGGSPMPRPGPYHKHRRGLVRSGDRAEDGSEDCAPSMNVEVTSKVAADLTSEILAEHEAVKAACRDAVAHAFRVGELLIEAKAQVKHGEWLPWLAANVPFSQSMARGYMQLARLDPEDRQRVGDLPLRGALEALGKLYAAPRRLQIKPPRGVEAVLDEAAMVLHKGAARMTEPQLADLARGIIRVLGALWNYERLLREVHTGALLKEVRHRYAEGDADILAFVESMLDERRERKAA